jgi:hypothetical protein
MFSKSLTKHFKGFRSAFTELHAKLDATHCSIFLSITDKTKHEVKKALVEIMLVHSVVSRGRLMQ